MRAGRGRTGFRIGLGSALFLAVLVAATPSEAPVADAAERGDLVTVRALVKAGEDVNAAQADGMTALHWAAVNGNLELAEVLVAAGATPRAKTRLGGYSALHLAAQSGSEGVVSALLGAGAEVDLRTETGVTSMHFAAQANAAGAIAALVAAGGQVDAPDDFQSRTPLMFASAVGAVDAMNALIRAGADVSLTSALKDYNEISRELSADRSRRSRLRAALEEPDEDGAEGRGGARGAGGRGAPPAAAAAAGRGGRQGQAAAQRTPPDQASAEEEEAEAPPPPPPVERPLWAMPLQTDNFQPISVGGTNAIGVQGGFAALHFAAREGHLEAARTLIASGADVDQPTGGDQSSPMVVATINGNYDIARLLLENGADPNLLSDDGVGPLFATLNIEWSLRTWYPQPAMYRQQQTNYLELMRLLLDAGAEVNQRTYTHTWYAAYNAGRMGVDFVGATPFWRAAYAADVDAMRLLVEYGADPNMTTVIPGREGDFEEDPDEPQQAEPAQSRTDPSGLPPNQPGDPAVHPIHAASGVGFGTSRVAQQHRSAPGGWLASMKYLVGELGINPNMADSDGLTPLHHAAARGDNETILYLVSMGADATRQGRRGQTTADQANSPEQRAQPHPKTIVLLEKLGSENNHTCRSCGG